MKTGFNIQIGVTLDVSERMAGLLASLAGGVRPSAPAEPETEKPAAPEAAAATETKEEAAAPAEPELPRQYSAEEAAAATAERKVTPAEVRAAADRMRLRIEGEGYEDPASEGRRRYHRQLTGWIKRTVAEITGGASEKPSELPDDVSRWNFIMQCDSVRLADDGEICFTPAVF